MSYMHTYPAYTARPFGEESSMEMTDVDWEVLKDGWLNDKVH